MKPILTTMTALALILSATHGANAAMNLNLPMNKPKPQIIKIKPPRIQVRRNLVKPVRAPRTKEASSATDAGPQPEPPTKPRVRTVRTAMIVPPLPRSKPDRSADEAVGEVFDYDFELIGLNLNEPTAYRGGKPQAYDEFEEHGKANGGDIDPAGALGPDFPAPSGFFDLFGVTTNPNDLKRIAELEDFRAMGEIAGILTDNPFDDPASALRQGRFGGGMDGPPAGDTYQLGTGGRDHDGWTLAYKGHSRDGSHGIQYRNGDTTWDRHESSDGTVTVIIIAVDEDGTVTRTAYQAGSSPIRLARITTRRNGETKTETGRIQNLDDEDGDGHPDDVEERNTEEEVDKGEDNAGEGEEEDAAPEQDTTAGGGDQGAPNDNDTGRGDGGCGTWTLFGGCTGTGPKAIDMTSQPNPTEDGSATVRSAGASIGPEAVTNGGDGSFVSGQGRGGGGSGLDPCATVAGCGGGGVGPEGPGGPGKPDG